MGRRVDGEDIEFSFGALSHGAGFVMTARVGQPPEVPCRARSWHEGARERSGKPTPKPGFFMRFWTSTAEVHRVLFLARARDRHQHAGLREVRGLWSRTCLVPRHSAHNPLVAHPDATGRRDRGGFLRRAPVHDFPIEGLPKG